MNLIAEFRCRKPGSIAANARRPTEQTKWGAS